MRVPLFRTRAGIGIDAKMTPMIDVIFLLLVFFLCTTGFEAPEAVLPTRLPRTGAASPKAARPPRDLEVIRVRLRGGENQCQVTLNGRTLFGMSDLVANLRRLGGIASDLPVILDIGPEVILGDVVAAYDGCLAAGLERISFAARGP